MVYPQAFGLYSIYHAVNTWLDTTEIFTVASIAIVTSIASWFYHVLTRQDTGVFYEVLYDEVLNTDRSLQRSREAGSGAADGAIQGLWQVYSEGQEVTSGSLVAIEVQNRSKDRVPEDQFDSTPLPHTYRLEFPGRKVVNFKVRNSGAPDYHYIVEELRQSAEASRRISIKDSNLTLPGVSLNPGQSFKLFVLLDDADVRVPGEKYAAPVMHSSVIDKLPPPRHTRQYVTTGLAVILALFVAGAGSIIGINVANRQSALNPACFTGTLTIEGSTAFSPIMNQVAAEYMQLCNGATIVLTANGSVQGYRDLAQNTRNVPDIVMYDGARQIGEPNDGWPADISVDPVGVVIFAVVGNSGLPPQDFTQGLTNAGIRGAFETPATPGATEGHPFAPAGRTTDSGTRQAFNRLVLNGTSNVETAAGVNCTDTTPIPAPPRFCLWSTTMELLRYVNDTDDAIGYAEADALPFFPNVRAIPIGGYSATRDNALSGNYTFLATEHLLTEGRPTTDENDFLTFLSSDSMTAKLQGNAFVACSSLSSALAGDCT